MVPIVSDLPAEVRAAFDVAVEARRRFRAALRTQPEGERFAVRCSAVKDLAAANRVLAAHHSRLPEIASRAAQNGEAS